MPTKRIRADLLAMQDVGYRDFQCRLMPTVPRERVIGVRTPRLRAYARRMGDEAAVFMAELPHDYYEENNLHAFLIERLGEWQATVDALARFLPYVDNWATCDMMRPAVLGQDPAAMRAQAYAWMGDAHPYTVRYGIEMLMLHGLGKNFVHEDLLAVAAVDCGEYYVSMMVAWYFATALAYHYAEVLPYLTEHRLDPMTHRRAITKAVESNRLSAEQKAFLRSLRN